MAMTGEQSGLTEGLLALHNRNFVRVSTSPSSTMLNLTDHLTGSKRAQLLGSESRRRGKDPSILFAAWSALDQPPG